MPNETEFDKLKRENQDLKDILNLLKVYVAESDSGAYAVGAMGVNADSAVVQMLARMVKTYSVDYDKSISGIMGVSVRNFK